VARTFQSAKRRRLESLGHTIGHYHIRMARGCFLSLLILAACFGGYWWLLHPHVEPPIVWWATGIASFFMWISFGTLQNAITAARDAARVSKESSLGGYTGEEFADDATVTVVGHIRAVGSPLTAPLSGKPAVLYSYEIDHTSESSDGESTKVMDFSGFAMTPSAIDSPHGSIRILGFPMLEGFEKRSLDTEDGRRNAAAYIQSATFTDMEGFHPGTVYSQIKEMLTDDDGQLRKDWRMTKGRDLTGKNLHEQIVMPGEQVCAIGRWSSAKHGLIAPAGQTIRLVQGDPQQIVNSLRSKFVSNMIGCVIVAAIINGAVFMMLQVANGRTSFLHDTPLGQHSMHAEEMDQAVRGGNIAAAEKLASNGTDIDVRDSDGRTPLAIAPDAAMARWLIAHGADVDASNPDGETVLMQQSAAGHADVVRELVKAGAKLDVVSTKWHSTALMRALDAEQLEVAQVLRDAGAKDQTVTETKGQALRDTDPPVRTVFAYLDAIQREDIAAMKKLSTFESFDNVDFKIWKESRPINPRLVHGYATADTATVEVRGPKPSGVNETWTYQLLRRGEDWRVSSERWETRLSGHEP